MNHQFQPINTETSSASSGININTGKIASAVRTTARLAGWMGFLGLGMQALPILAILGTGCMFVFRSYMSSRPQIPFTPPPMQQSFTPSTAAMPMPMPARHTKPDPELMQFISAPAPREDSEPEPRRRPVQRNVIESRVLPPPTYATDEAALEAPDRWQQQRAAILNPTGGRERRTMQQAALEMAGELTTNNPVTGINIMSHLSNQPGSQPPFDFQGRGVPAIPFGQGSAFGSRSMQQPQLPRSNNPLYESMAGRDFEGTCQMPSEPSRRMKLTIGRIRDRGRNLTARFTTLEGPRKILNFKGLIEHNPSRLTLISQLPPRKLGGGYYGVRRGWIKQPPKRVTLYLDSGKLLTGESTNGEMFELAPKEEPPEPVAAAIPPSIRNMEIGEQFKWKLAHRDNKPLPGEHYWLFHQTSRSTGEFTWTENDNNKSSGRYIISRSSSTVTLALETKSGREKRYQCRVKPNGTAGDLLVSVPRKPGKLDGNTDYSFSLELEN